VNKVVAKEVAAGSGQVAAGAEENGGRKAVLVVALAAEVVVKKKQKKKKRVTKSSRRKELRKSKMLRALLELEKRERLPERPPKTQVPLQKQTVAIPLPPRMR